MVELAHDADGACDHAAAVHRSFPTRVVWSHGSAYAQLRRKIMFHLIWYLLVGLLAGVIAKSVMHTHLTTFWTIALGIIGSIIGGAVTHMFLRPTNERYHPAGLIFSTLGAILVLFACHKLKIRFPQF